MLNVIINGFNGEVLEKVLADFSENIGLNYANVVYFEKAPKGLKAHEIDLLQYDKIFDIRNYPLDPNLLTPLDEKLISGMSDCERIVLKMIDRKEIARKYSYQDRVDFYHYLLRYWNHIIEMKQIDLYVGSNIPHEIYDFIIVELCKYKNIPTLFFYNESQTADTVVILHDWKTSHLGLLKKYTELKENFADKSIDDVKLDERFQNYFLNAISPNPDKPFYMKGKFNVLTKLNVAGELSKRISRLFWRQPLQTLRLMLGVFGKQIKNCYFDLYYRSISRNPDLGVPYIYFALHYQPELTTSPLADAFVDQILIVQMLSKHLPDGVKIYVKEHPKQACLGRSIGFYKDLASTKGVVLARKSFSSIELTKNASAIATVTGTVGWEAISKCKPVLMFGSYIYQFCDGVRKIITNEDCELAMKDIFGGKNAMQLKNFKIFLKALEEVAVEAVVDSAYNETSKLSREKKIRNLSEALLREAKISLRKKDILLDEKGINALSRNP